MFFRKSEKKASSNFFWGEKKRKTRKIGEVKGKIFDYATPDPITISYTATIIDASKKMKKSGYRRIPVVEGAQKYLKGIVAAMDILRLLARCSSPENWDKNVLKTLNSPIASIMTPRTELIVASVDIEPREAIEKMISGNVGALPIVDREDRIVGIVTERDFVVSLSEDDRGLKVLDLMSRNVVSVNYNGTVGDVIKTMCDSGYRRLVVLDDDMNYRGMVTSSSIIGLISSGRIFRYIRNNKFSDILNLPLTNIIDLGVPTVTSEMNIRDVAFLIDLKGFGGFPVLFGTKVKGIITERDLLKAFYR